LTPAQREARGRIGACIEQYRAMTEVQRKTLSEANVVHQFLDPFFRALGWPVGDPERFKYELSTYAGRPDMLLIPERGGNLFVEAKRFNVIKELAQSRKTIAGIVTPGQMALPGMAADRTPEEQQAINYAFENGGVWAILTNFERLRLFNARRDWLVLSFERPSAYLEEFDLLWQLSYHSICSGGLALLSNQRHREDVDTDYLAFINGWRERLAQDIIARRADNPWAFMPDGRVNLADLRAVVQRVLDRLVVIRFAEDHLVLPAGTLHSFYELCRDNPYTFTLSEFFQRLYRRFDEYHNSALFAPHLADRAVFGDPVLSELVGKLYEARYRAMSADIMGNTYEQYLGKTLAHSNGDVVTIDNLETRKKQGSYYTPQVIVRYLVDNSLGRYLYATADGRPDGPPLPGERPKTAAEIRGLRVLDPACGSGSFLIYAYQVLAEFYQREIMRLEAEQEQRYQELVKQGVTTPLDLQVQLTPWQVEMDRLQDYPRLVLETHLYGVDLDPQAAEIATVNLVMRAMASQPRSKRRLPLILDQNIKVGNSLVGAGPDDPRYAEHAAELAELRRLRLALAAQVDGAKHQEAIDAIAALAGRVNAALDGDLAEHFRSPAALRPFNWGVGFPEVFVDAEGGSLGEEAGFQIVVGNPPWEILKPDLREFYAQFDERIESKLTRRRVEARIAELNAEDPAREAGWEAQKARIKASAAYLRRSPDYTRQGRGDTATHKLFLERGYGVLGHGGRLGVVIPSGIYTDLGTKPLREMLLSEGTIEFLFSFANNRGIFPEVHRSYKVVLLGFRRGVSAPYFPALFRVAVSEAVTIEDMEKVLQNPSLIIKVKPEMIRRFSPNSLSIMEFRSQRDVDVTEKIYDEWPLLGEQVDGTWNPRLSAEFHMTNDRALFNRGGVGLPLYEGKMVHQFEAHFAAPRYWVEEKAGRARLLRKGGDGAEKLAYEKPRLVFRDIASNTNERTLISAVIPPGSFCNNKAPYVILQDCEMPEHVMMFVGGVFNSFVLDYVIRHKVSTTLNFFYMYQLPVPRLTAGNPYFEAIVPRAARLTCTTPEFAGLWEEVMGEAWGPSSGVSDPGGRQVLRDELDALVAHLYGLRRGELDHVLGTFPLVFREDAAGQARREAVLAMYDRFAGEVDGWR